MRFHQRELSRIGEVADLDVGQPRPVRGHAMEEMPVAVVRADFVHYTAAEGAPIDVPIRG
jgi:hypothetical protein